MKTDPICLLKLHHIINIKQYRLSGGHDEITKTVQEWEGVRITRPTHSLYYSPYGQSESQMVCGK